MQEGFELSAISRNKTVRVTSQPEYPFSPAKTFHDIMKSDLKQKTRVESK